MTRERAAPEDQPSRWKGQVLAVLAFPLGLAGSVGLALGVPTLGVAPEFALFAVLLSSLVWVLLAERVAPYDRSPRRTSSRDAVVDGTSMAVMMTLVDPLLKAFWPIAVMAVWRGLGQPGGLGLFSGAHVLGLKVSAALLLAGLGEYGLHRLSHHWRPMWGFHALHHSADRIYWLNGFRSHPVNVAWHQLAGYAVLLFLGIDAETLLVFSAVSITVATFQHANARLRLGPLNYVFSTNELHRWHHDSRPGRSYVNYGSVLSFWDLIFGTFHLRPDEQPGRPGLEAGSASSVPNDRYWAQVFGPLRRPGRYATDVNERTR